MTDKPPAHPPRQARHPGRGQVAPQRRQVDYERSQHDLTMRRPPEPISTANHTLQPHGPENT